MKTKILVVADEFNSRTLMAQLLQDEGYIVDTADNGKSALQNLNNEYNVLITDIKMPLMDGVELFHKAKELYPRISVILFAAYGTIDSAAKALKDGAFYYLEKPVNFDLLNHTINQALDIQKLEAEINNLRNQIEEKKSDKPLP